MRKHGGKKLFAGVLVAILAMCVVSPGAAYAARSGASGNNMKAEWAIPTTPMTDTVVKKVDGQDKLYKVITTWAMAWSTSGPDFLGINNSSFYGNGGNGNANVTTAQYGSSSTLLGVWASSANENPNAFNWNTWYNLYADDNKDKNLAKSTFACTTNQWDGESGVFGPFKYRPEIVWLCNNLSASGAASNVSLINQGKYYSSGTGITAGGTGEITIDGTEAKTVDAKDVSKYKVEGDETYNPFIIQPVNSNPYTFVESAYELADMAKTVIDETASKDGKYGDTAVTEGNVTWQNMNALPRSNRYTETPEQCALAVEKLARGSVYYTLKMLKEGKDASGNALAKKKVAYVCTAPGSVDDTHVVVAVYDYTEDISGGVTASTSVNGMAGTASWSPLVVKQLGDGDKLDVYGGADHNVITTGTGLTGTNYDVAQPSMTYSLYIADANDLAGCDVIYATNASYTQQQWKAWLKANTSKKSLKANLDKVQIYTDTPYVCNGSNFTMDKLIYGCYALDCIYPELFPNLELSTYWYDKVYHIKSKADGDTTGNILQNAMAWAFSSATQPNSAAKTSSGAVDTSNYKAEETDAKFAAGLTYFNGNKDADETIKRVLANKRLDGKTGDYKYTNFEPSKIWNTGSNTQKKKSHISVASFNVTKKMGSGAGELKAKDTFDLGVKLTAGNNVLTATSSDEKVITVAADGKSVTATVVGTGTAKVTVSAEATDAYEAPASKELTVTIDGPKQVISVSKDAGVDNKGALTVKMGANDINLGATVADEAGKAISGATISYKSDNARVADVDENGKIEFVNTGTAKITITSKAANYGDTTKVITVTVEPAAQTLSITSGKNLTFSLDGGKQTSNITATASGSIADQDAGSISYSSSNEAVATVDSKGVITVGGTYKVTSGRSSVDRAQTPGTATITVKVMGTAFYPAVEEAITVTVNGKTQTITAEGASKRYGDADFELGATTNGGGTLSYKSLDTKVVIVDDSGKVSIVGAGSADITIGASAAGDYAAATKTVTITVSKAIQAPTIAKTSKTVKLSKLKKAKQTVAINKLKNGQGNVTYSIKKANKKKSSFSINKTTGKITVKKGLGKGTYKLTVTAKAAGDGNYLSASKDASVTIKVK